MSTFEIVLWQGSRFWTAASLSGSVSFVYFFMFILFQWDLNIQKDTVPVEVAKCKKMQMQIKQNEKNCGVSILVK